MKFVSRFGKQIIGLFQASAVNNQTKNDFSSINFTSLNYSSNTGIKNLCTTNNLGNSHSAACFWTGRNLHRKPPPFCQRPASKCRSRHVSRWGAECCLLIGCPRAATTHAWRSNFPTLPISTAKIKINQLARLLL